MNGSLWRVCTEARTSILFNNKRRFIKPASVCSHLVPLERATEGATRTKGCLFDCFNKQPEFAEKKGMGEDENVNIVVDKIIWMMAAGCKNGNEKVELKENMG